MPSNLPHRAREHALSKRRSATGATHCPLALAPVPPRARARCSDA